ncbi:MAG: glycosyltransferase family 4 protein [Pseudomonadota bacterium]
MRDYSLPDMTGRTVLQVIPDLAAGGAERTTIEMAEAIVLAGGTALVASRGGRLEDELQAAGGEFIRMNVRSKNPVAMAGNARRLARLIRERGVDIIHARSRAPAWSAKSAAHRTGIAFVTTYHGAYGGTSALKKRYNGVMAAGDRVIANSDWIAQHVRAEHGVDPSRLVTIPRGVDLEAFDPANVSGERVTAFRDQWGLSGAPDTALVLLLPGRLTGWKGHAVAVDALARLDRIEQDTFRLVFAGDPQGRDAYVQDLQDRIVDADLTSVVRIVDHAADMPAAYLASDIVLAPSTRPEAFGRVAAEASAMGRPVIASDHGGARETIVEGLTGARFRPDDAAEMAGAMRTLRDIGPGGRQAMGEAGRAHVTEHFSKRGLQIATLKVYRDVLDERA